MTTETHFSCPCNRLVTKGTTCRQCGRTERDSEQYNAGYNAALFRVRQSLPTERNDEN